MCGIVGFIDKNKSLDTLKNMLEIQSYRGPDDSGIYFDEKSGVHYGHNRLSIQDISSHGHQPFISDCLQYIIIFNGEIYNFKTIRSELTELGYNFISNSDTEVILYSYKQWGVKCIDKFVGMFAFSIFDKKQRKLILVRDRTGVKPLYYYIDKEQFMFSSELKSFHKHPKFRKVQNSEVLPYFFQFGYIPSPHTIFKNCFKLEAGHYLELSTNNLEFKITKYWDVNDYYLQEKLSKNETEVIGDIEKILDNAISLRMISDVPIGVFLSGGLDSSLVVSMLSKKHNKQINTFTIGFEDQDYNEAKYAKKVAAFLGTNHTEYYMKSSDMLNLIEDLPFYYDEPFGDSSALPTMIVSKLARQTVTVALSADGGDETFCGYSKYFFLNKHQNIFSNNFKRKLLKTSLKFFSSKSIENINNKIPKRLKQTNIKDKYEKFKRAINSNNPEEMFENASSYEDKVNIRDFLTIEKNPKIFKKWHKIGNIDFLNQMMAIDYKLFMSDDVLTKVDRATMSVSLEGREPLLDHRIIEYMARVPLHLKYKNQQGKYLLKQILYKYLPKEMVDKPKSGFQIPLNEWLRDELKPLVLKYLDNIKLDKDIFDINKINSLKKRFFEGEDSGSTIWFILMYQMWKERWLEQ
jgi:asparagine synthase (glutamine-hydrolysing)